MRGVHMEVGNRLRELRLEHGLRMVDVAALVGRDQSVVQRYESGRTAVPDDVKRALMERYDVSAEYLMGWDSEPDLRPAA